VDAFSRALAASSFPIRLWNDPIDIISGLFAGRDVNRREPKLRNTVLVMRALLARKDRVAR
jgi:hypothetical protein